jgi:hypothetical protein
VLPYLPFKCINYSLQPVDSVDHYQASSFFLTVILRYLTLHWLASFQVHQVSRQQGRVDHGNPRFREKDPQANQGVQVAQPAHQHRGDAQAAHRQVSLFRLFIVFVCLFGKHFSVSPDAHI